MESSDSNGANANIISEFNEGDIDIPKNGSSEFEMEWLENQTKGNKTLTVHDALDFNRFRLSKLTLTFPDESLEKVIRSKCNFFFFSYDFTFFFHINLQKHAFYILMIIF